MPDKPTDTKAAWPAASSFALYNLLFNRDSAAFQRLYKQERTGMRQNSFNSVCTVPYQHIHNQFSHLPANNSHFVSYIKEPRLRIIYILQSSTAEMLFNI